MLRVVMEPNAGLQTVYSNYVEAVANPYEVVLTFAQRNFSVLPTPEAPPVAMPLVRVIISHALLLELAVLLKQQTDAVAAAESGVKPNP